MNIVVLAGGLSPERNVSLVSGSLIAESLVSSGHKVLLLDVYTGTVIPEEGIAALRRQMEEIGYEVVVGRGDFKKEDAI